MRYDLHYVTRAGFEKVQVIEADSYNDALSIAKAYVKSGEKFSELVECQPVAVTSEVYTDTPLGEEYGGE